MFELQSAYTHSTYQRRPVTLHVLNRHMWFMTAMLDREDTDPREARVGILRPARKGRQTPSAGNLSLDPGNPGEDS